MTHLMVTNVCHKALSRADYLVGPDFLQIDIVLGYGIAPCFLGRQTMAQCILSAKMEINISLIRIIVFSVGTCVAPYYSGT